MATINPQPRVLFHEEQQFRQKWLWLLVFGIFLIESPVFCYLLVKQLIFGQPVGNQPMLNAVLIVLGPAMIFLSIGLLYLFYKLKLITEVYEDSLLIRFYPFVRRRILFSALKYFEARTYRPIWEYGGWGIRYGWKGTAYNVSGNRGVQLVLTNGKRILIGSQKPEELIRVIKAGMKQ